MSAFVYIKKMLNERLKRISLFVDKNSVLCDVGTDHAYLPIYLTENGITNSCIASDIKKGPLDKAKENISQHGLTEKIRTVLTDGLTGLGKYSPTNVIIAGMGGENIADIIKNADFDIKHIKFILQPMTKEDVLRRFLYENGFSITDESVVKDGNRFYQIIVCVFTGEKEICEEFELLLGKINNKKREKEFTLFAQSILKREKTKYEGLKKSGKPVEEIENLIKQIEQIKGTNQNDDI